MKNILPYNSLRELPIDTRDFNLGAVFPQIDISELPNKTFLVAQPICIKEQPEGDDMCAGYAVTSVSEDQEGVELLPGYQFYKTKELSGDPEKWGADLRDACKSACKFGSAPATYNLSNFRNISREKALNKDTWPNYVDEIAILHKKQTYFSVDGKYDTFDNIRIALWMNREKKCSIVTGILWRSEWLDAPWGIIPEKYGSFGFGHAFKIFGQKLIDDEIYLVAQLSQGRDVGDHGLFYFSRKVVNAEIGKYGIFMFNDMTKEEAKQIINGENSIIKKIWSFLLKIFKKI